MVGQLEILGFKCFVETTIPLKGLTVLAGINSVGKSSVIQSLLLLRCSLEKVSMGADRVPLNGEYLLGLGNSIDIIAKNSPSDIVTVVYSFNDHKERVSLYADSKEPQVYLKIVYPESPNVFSKRTSDPPIIRENFHYLHAERLGPRAFYGVTDKKRNVGSQGEYTISLLSSSSVETGDFDVPEEKMFEGSTNPRLRFQVEAWMDFLIPGTKINPQKIIEINQAYVQFDRSTPYNVGFGVSYVLPIVVSGLIAKKGEMLIIENPEAHLHPLGQSNIGKFLSKVAASGVQVILETHSEHVINGIRISSLDGTINNDDIVINFFSKEGGEIVVKPIGVNDAGDLTHYPRGFFDQQQRDFAEIVKNKRKQKQ